MGDRCYVSITLHGPIRAVEQFTRLIIFLQERRWDDNGDIETALMWAIVKGEEPQLSCDEVNYGNTDEEQEFFQKEGIAYHIENGAGGSYGNGCVSWAPGWTTAVQSECNNEGDPVISLSELVSLRKYGDIDVAIKSLEMASGKELPDFEASEEVKRLFAKEIAEYALNLSTELETT